MIQRLFFDTWDLYTVLHINTVFLYMTFFTSRCSKLVRCVFYLVHSLSTWFTHFFISHLFRLGTTPAPPRHGGYSYPSLLDSCPHIYPLDEFVLTIFLCLYMYPLFCSSCFIRFVNLFVFLIQFEKGGSFIFDLMMIIWCYAWISRKEFVDNCLINYFSLTGVFGLCINETLSNFW